MNQNIKCTDGNESKYGFELESDSEEISVDGQFSSDEEIESHTRENHRRLSRMWVQFNRHASKYKRINKWKKIKNSNRMEK